MLIMSILAAGGILMAYLMNGVVPGTLPYSLLRDAGAYHGILALLTITWGLYVWHSIRARQVAEMVGAGGIGVALMALQNLTNGTDGHDLLAAILMVMTCLLTLKVALRLQQVLLVFLSMMSLTSASLIVTQDPLLIAVAENTIVLVTLFVLTVDERRQAVSLSVAIERPWSAAPDGVLRLPSIDWPGHRDEVPMACTSARRRVRLRPRTDAGPWQHRQDVGVIAVAGTRACVHTAGSLACSWSPYGW